MQKKNYWEDRALENSQEIWKATKKTKNELRKLYEQSAKELEKEMLIWLEKYEFLHDLDASAMKSIMNTKEAANFRYTVAEYMDKINKLKLESSPFAQDLLREFDIASGKIRYRRYKELISQVNMEVLELANNALGKTEKHLKDTFLDAYHREIFEVQKGFEIGSTFNNVSPEQIEKIFKQKWSEKHFDSRIWDNSKRLASNLQQTITKGIIQGKEFKRMSKDIQDVMGVGFFEARRILETETTFALEQAKTEAYKELGIEKYQFIATLDNKTSKKCQDYDLEVIDLNKKQIGVNAPPLHPFCRSVTTPYIKDLKDAKRLARDFKTGKTYKIPANTKYEDWLKNYENNGIIQESNIEKEVNRKNWSESFKKKILDEHRSFEKEEVKMSVHALERFTNRSQKNNFPEVNYGDVVKILKQSPKYLDYSNGETKEVYFESEKKYAVIKNIANQEIVTFLRLGKPSEDWVKKNEE